MAYLMGIDIGSTSIKAVVYDAGGNCVASGSQTTPLSYLNPAQPTWCVWEPDKIWGAIVAAIRQALGTMDHPEEVKAIAVTGFGMDGLPLDKEGKELYPLISWHCPRTIPQFEAFTAKATNQRIFEITGLQPTAINALYRMIWLKENHPEIMEKTDKWLLIEDYINYRLCGTMSTEYSMGTCFSLFDHSQKQWSKELVDLAGIPLSILPPVNPSGTVLGPIKPAVAAETGLSPSTQIILGGHDYICGALAVGAIDDTVLLDITGTWEMLVQSSSTFNVSPSVFASGYWVEGHVARDKFCFVGSAVSGDMTEWMKAQLADASWDAISQSIAATAPGANGCFFLPHFSGAGAPIFDPNSMGAFLGLHNAVTKADMMRAVFEGLDYQFRMMLDSFRAAKIGNTQRIIASGGACKNKFWMQNKADVTGLPLEVPELYEATPLGAAMLAGIGCGVYSSESEAVESVRKPSVSYEPNMETHKIYDGLYREIFCQLQTTLAGINKDISKRFR